MTALYAIPTYRIISLLCSSADIQKKGCGKPAYICCVVINAIFSLPGRVRLRWLREPGDSDQPHFRQRVRAVKFWRRHILCRSFRSDWKHQMAERIRFLQSILFSVKKGNHVCFATDNFKKWYPLSRGGRVAAKLCRETGVAAAECCILIRISRK